MLYDNALLSRLYLHYYQATHEEFARNIAEGILDYVLRELTDPAGLNLEVFTPPSQTPPAKGFPAERFTLTLIDGRATLTCPAGQTTQSRDRNEDNTA